MTKRIGKYEIQAEIGKGGFGNVYVAFDPIVNRQVAIKILISPEDPDVLGRFRAEAAAAGRLRHRNVVTVYDYGEQDGWPYLVMEFLEGETLQQLLQGPRKLSLLEKMAIMSQTAEGLYCAHKAGIIHRDVKPSNIMVLRDGTVKIMDFGIARALQSDTTRRTRTGFLIGTLSYMCPEQFQGGTIDELCDIWAYGVIYFELVTGVHPFHASDTATLMYRINNVEPPAVLPLCPDCPGALAAVLQKTLAKHRELRYQSFQDVQYDTEPILIDLKRERAAVMASDARNLMDNGEIDAANTLIRSIFDLDPSNPEARQLREAIQEQLQWRAVKPRVEALVKSAEEFLAQRQFPEAIQIFESALRLDSGDTSLRIRIEQAQIAYDQSRRAVQLLADAQQQLKVQDLTAAHRSVTEALRNDPQNPQAGQLLETINQDIEKRKQRRQLEQSLTAAGELLTGGDPDGAVEMLIDLNLRHPLTPAVMNLLAHAQSLQAEAERKKRMRAEMDRARGLLDESRFSEAVRLLERLVSEFAHDESFISLLAAAREGLKSQERGEKIRRVMEQAQTFLSHGQFGRAVDILVDAVGLFPGDEAVAALLKKAVDAKAADDRKQQVSRTVRRAEELSKVSRFAEALEIVDAAIREHGKVSELAGLRGRLAAALEAQIRSQAVTDAKAGADQLLNAGRPADALALLTREAKHHNAAEELGPIIDRAEQARRDQLQTQQIRERLDEAAALEQKGRTAEALAAVEALLRKHPKEASALEADKRLRKLLAAQEREKRFGDLIHRIKKSLAAGDWSAALGQVRAGQAEFSGDARLLALAAEAEEGQRRADEAHRLELERQQQENQRLSSTQLLSLPASPSPKPPPAPVPSPAAPRKAPAPAETKSPRPEQTQPAATSPPPAVTPAVPSTSRGKIGTTPDVPPPAAPVRGVPPVPPPAASREKPKRTLAVAIGAAATLVVVAAGTWMALHTGTGKLADVVVSATPLSFQYQIGADNPAPQGVSVSGPAGQTFTARADAAWIAVRPGSGSLTNTPETVHVVIDPGGLRAGTYNGEVRIGSTQTGSAVHKVPVTLSVLPEAVKSATLPPPPGTPKPSAPQPFLEIIPPSLEFTAKAGSAVSGAIKVRVTPGTQVSAVVSTGKDWLSTRRPSMLTETNSVDTLSLSVAADAAKLAPRKYLGSLSVSAAGINKVVPVTLTVETAIPPKAPSKEVTTPPKPEIPEQKQPVTRPSLPKFSLENYGGPRLGTLRWQGELQPGTQLTIQAGGRASAGTVRGVKWDAGVPIGDVQVSPPAVLVQEPSEANQWNVVIANRGNSVLDSISISWRVKP